MMNGELAPLRVAFVAGLATGGSARHVAALAAGCRAAGLAVSVLAPAPTLALAGTAAGIETFALSISERPRPVSDMFAVARLRNRLASWRPDVVHAHGMRAGAVAGLAMTGLAMTGAASGGLAGTRVSSRGLRNPAHRRRPPALAVTVHNAPPAGRRSRLVYGVLERICARRADLVLCASADLAVRMRDLGAAEVHQFDVPAPVARQPSPADVARARDDVGAGGRPVVLAVGRLAPQKGFDVLIEAAGRWRHREPQPRTVIAGDGPLAAELRAQAGRALADVVLLGPRQDVPALLEIADVVVVPSRWEARALILQEAMRAGKPIVATSVGGTPDLVGGHSQDSASQQDSAVLIPPDDPAALAAAVTAVLDDPRLAARLRLAAKTRSATFPTESDAIKAAMSTYARLAAGRS
jgi:glycosyltransferase involved in cell wall biosynthesis